MQGKGLPRSGRWRVEEKQQKKKKNLTMWTKYLLDFMFYSGILVTATLPFTIRQIGKALPHMAEHYWVTVAIYFVLGVAALALIRELRRIFQTVLREDCFVQENVDSQPGQDGELELLHRGDVGGALRRLHDRGHGSGDIGVRDRRPVQQGAGLCVPGGRAL